MASQVGCYGYFPELAIVGVLFVAGLVRVLKGFDWGFFKLGGGTIGCFVCGLAVVSQLFLVC
ncbi:hypothetical protein RDI58_019723 [Solanum bulbocastanum]|uniref:Uncharacterized protein n=1 Tax=Solanum bulbocastanum TaxID=147425 RepID=A0AAN8TBF6_SOLBU